MLHYKLTGDILEVIQMTATFTDTKYQYWYYDIKNWKRSVSGALNSTPCQEMTENEIAWVKKYYLPKVGM